MTPEESGAESADRARFEAELLERLQEEMRRLTVADHLLHLMQILPSLAFQHLGLTPESQGDRDLAQSRLAIDAFRALLEVVAPLRPADEVGMYRSTLAQMQMAFVAQVERESAPPEEDEVVEADYERSDGRRRRHHRRRNHRHYRRRSARIGAAARIGRAARAGRRGPDARRRGRGRDGRAGFRRRAEGGRVSASGGGAMPKAEVGVFGGSGFYSFLEDVEEVVVETPYGPPSDSYLIGEVGGVRVAFLPRHGRRHQLPPHAINYRANVWGMKELGVTRLFGPCASGSLQKQVKPGDFVVADQFVDRTNARKDTFYDGPITTHVSSADPYCPILRRALIDQAKVLGIDVHERGTVVVVQGPRFSTRAESKWYGSAGWEVINMTAYPEGYLARELELCYANVSLITDYDVGVGDDPGVSPVSHAEVIRVFEANNARLRDLLFAVIPTLPHHPRDCGCGSALAGAR